MYFLPRLILLRAMDGVEVFEHVQSWFHLSDFALALGLTHSRAGFAASPFRTKSFLLTGIFPIRAEIRSTFGQSQANSKRPAGCSIIWGLLSNRKFITTGWPARQTNYRRLQKNFHMLAFFQVPERHTHRERGQKNTPPLYDEKCLPPRPSPPF